MAVVRVCALLLTSQSYLASIPPTPCLLPCMQDGAVPGGLEGAVAERESLDVGVAPLAKRVGPLDGPGLRVPMPSLQALPAFPDLFLDGQGPLQSSVGSPDLVVSSGRTIRGRDQCVGGMHVAHPQTAWDHQNNPHGASNRCFQ